MRDIGKPPLSTRLDQLAPRLVDRRAAVVRTPALSTLLVPSSVRR